MVNPRTTFLRPELFWHEGLRASSETLGHLRYMGLLDVAPGATDLFRLRAWNNHRIRAILAKWRKIAILRKFRRMQRSPSHRFYRR